MTVEIDWGKAPPTLEAKDATLVLLFQAKSEPIMKLDGPILAKLSDNWEVGLLDNDGTWVLRIAGDAKAKTLGEVLQIISGSGKAKEGPDFRRSGKYPLRFRLSYSAGRGLNTENVQVALFQQTDPKKWQLTSTNYRLLSNVADVPSKSVAEDKKEAWRSDLSEFTKSVAEVGKKAKVPTEKDLLNNIRQKTVFTNKDQQPIWVLDESAPAGEVQADLTKQFTGKVRWKGEVESVEPDAKTKTVRVELLLPIPKDLPKGGDFVKTMSLTLPETAKLPKRGDKFSFTGELKKAKADDLFPPVWVIYGVGTNAGKMRFGIIPAAVEGQ